MPIDLEHYRESQRLKKIEKQLEELFYLREAFVPKRGVFGFFLLFIDKDGVERAYRIEDGTIKNRVLTAGGTDVRLALQRGVYMNRELASISEFVEYGAQYDGFFDELYRILNSSDDPLSTEEIFRIKKDTEMINQAIRENAEMRARGEGNFVPVLGEMKIVPSSVEEKPLGDEGYNLELSGMLEGLGDEVMGDVLGDGFFDDEDKGDELHSNVVSLFGSKK